MNSSLALIERFTDHGDIIPPVDREALQRHAGNYLGGDITQLPHAKPISPFGVVTINRSPRHENYDVETAVTNTIGNRTFSKLRPIDTISEREFALIVSAALQAHYGPLKASAKHVANDAGASIATAKNWLAGLCPPSSVYLKRLEAKVPGLAAEMRRLTALEAEIDPDFQRELTSLLRRVGAR